MVVILVVLAAVGCVFCALNHKGFEPLEWPHRIGFAIIALIVLALMGAVIRPDWIH